MFIALVCCQPEVGLIINGNCCPTLHQITDMYSIVLPSINVRAWCLMAWHCCSPQIEARWARLKTLFYLLTNLAWTSNRKIIFFKINYLQESPILNSQCCLMVWPKRNILARGGSFQCVIILNPTSPDFSIGRVIVQHSSKNFVLQFQKNLPWRTGFWQRDNLRSTKQ